MRTVVIRESGSRFCEKIMLAQENGAGSDAVGTEWALVGKPGLRPYSTPGVASHRIATGVKVLRNCRTILVVEDSDDDFDAVTRVFRRELAVDNPVHRCEDGKEALRYLAEGGRGAEALPAVILLDLNLPGIDGRQVLADVKGDERLRMIPVLVMTNSDAQRDIRDCYRMGANCYVRKSLDWPSFVKTMAHLKGFWFDTAILPEA